MIDDYACLQGCACDGKHRCLQFVPEMIPRFVKFDAELIRSDGRALTEGEHYHDVALQSVVSGWFECVSLSVNGRQGFRGLPRPGGVLALEPGALCEINYRSADSSRGISIKIGFESATARNAVTGKPRFPYRWCQWSGFVRFNLVGRLGFALIKQYHDIDLACGAVVDPVRALLTDALGGPIDIPREFKPYTLLGHRNDDDAPTYAQFMKGGLFAEFEDSPATCARLRCRVGVVRAAYKIPAKVRFLRDGSFPRFLKATAVWLRELPPGLRDGTAEENDGGATDMVLKAVGMCNKATVFRHMDFCLWMNRNGQWVLTKGFSDDVRKGRMYCNFKSGVAVLVSAPVGTTFGSSGGPYESKLPVRGFHGYDGFYTLHVQFAGMANVLCRKPLCNEFWSVNPREVCNERDAQGGVIKVPWETKETILTVMNCVSCKWKPTEHRRPLPFLPKELVFAILGFLKWEEFNARGPPSSYVMFPNLLCKASAPERKIAKADAVIQELYDVSARTPDRKEKARAYQIEIWGIFKDFKAATAGVMQPSDAYQLGLLAANLDQVATRALNWSRSETKASDV